MKYSDLMLQQVSEQMKHIKNNLHDLPSPPKNGWLELIRTTLGMSMEKAAKRSGVTPVAWNAAEKREVKGTISIENLRKFADALDCDVEYLIVPRRPLVEMVRAQIEKRAKQEVQAIIRTMELEGQKPSDWYAEQLQASLSDKYFRNNIKNIW